MIALDRECTGNPVTNCWCVLTNEVVHYKGRDHIQFNSMYVTTLKDTKDHHILTSGPKFAGIANPVMLDYSSMMAVAEAEAEVKVIGVDGAHLLLW